MDGFVIGFTVIIILFMGIKALRQFRMYSKSIYKAIYSNFTEYRMRQKSITGMSESYRFNETFGKHRMIFQIIQQKNKHPMAFITLFLTSGCYIINVKNNAGTISFCKNGKWKYSYDQKGKMKSDEFDNPFNELRAFQANIMKDIKTLNKIPVNLVAVFPDKCVLNIENKEHFNEIAIQRSSLINSILTIHKKSRQDTLLPLEIDHIFETLVADALKEEES